MDNAVSFFSNNVWITQSAAVILLGFFAQVIEAIFYRVFSNRFKKQKKLVSYSAVEAIHPPLALFIWFLVFSIILQIVIVKFNLDGSFTQYANCSRRVVAILFVLWFFLRMIKGVEHTIVTEKRLGRREFSDTTTINALAQVIRVLVVVIVLLMLLQAMGQPIGTILAFGGIGGLAISFAAKDTLANFIGGLMLYWDRPFSVGDVVRCLDKGIDGSVEKIGWRLTRLRSYDKRAIYVPNSVFSNSSIENITRMTNRRIRLNLGLRYEDADKILEVCQGIQSMLQSHPDLDSSLDSTVAFEGLGDSSLNILVQTFTRTTSWSEFNATQQDVLLKIMDIVADLDADFAFPTTTVSIPDGIELLQSEEGGNGDGQLQ